MLDQTKCQDRDNDTVVHIAMPIYLCAAAKQEIHKLMVDLAGRGMAIVMISSELPEIIAMSDRIVVMRAGRIRGELSNHISNQETTPEKILSLALGHE
jgi:ABC-type sugar transport system ATPase subunit